MTLSKIAGAATLAAMAGASAVSADSGTSVTVAAASGFTYNPQHYVYQDPSKKGTSGRVEDLEEYMRIFKGHPPVLSFDSTAPSSGDRLFVVFNTAYDAGNRFGVMAMDCGLFTRLMDDPKAGNALRFEDGSAATARDICMENASLHLAGTEENDRLDNFFARNLGALNKAAARIAWSMAQTRAELAERPAVQTPDLEIYRFQASIAHDRKPLPEACREEGSACAGEIEKQELQEPASRDSDHDAHLVP